MKIQAVEFAGMVARPGAPPPGRLPQVAFAGRSNVGKSSLINRLLGRTRSPIAHVSVTPGRTQQIHFYLVRAVGSRGGDFDFYLVDLPGYGFAHVPLEVRQRWRPLIERYLSGTPELRGVVQLIDARQGPTTEDRRMMQYLAGQGLPTLFALTKVDKLKASDRQKMLAGIVEALDVDEEQIVPFSARTGEGRDVLLGCLEDLLRQGGE
ncbi:MAG: YihA family ribosome biogenesis GTP-binding protein [Gemmatimonadetes bacterium]|nr:YihA family ribosome biogenesis GTP-binding protein [Gemmatimonadota bacterium]